jgi:ABC-type transport system involved in cytochrome c biogenesis ATPase subunit
VLTGLYEPTSGIGRIAGYDIRTDIQKIHHHLGVCPQFDIQHADLTAEEHLLFYARLKGVKWRKEKEVVKKALRQVKKCMYYGLVPRPLPIPKFSILHAEVLIRGTRLQLYMYSFA